MGEPVEQGRGHLGVAEDGGPFGETAIGGDDRAGALIELAQQVEQQGAARGAERQVAALIEDDEVRVDEAAGDLTGLSQSLLLFEGIDELDGREEADPPVMMLDGVDAESRGDLGLADTGTADQDDVVRVVGELAAMELAHERSLTSLVVKSKPARSR